LKAQAGATTTVQGSGPTRGLSLSYGEDDEAAADKPSVVSVPTPSTTIAATPPAQVPVAATVAPTAQPAASSFATAPASVPTYTETTTEATPVTTVTLSSPSAPTVTVPSAVPASTVSSYPTTPLASTYEVIQPPVVQQVAVRPDPASYSSVDTAQRIDLRIFFEWNSASLKPEAIGQLAELCTAIRLVGASPDNRFKIIGHTDKSGSDQYNLYLSNARAREVKRHLVEECALPPAALIAVGEGERQSSPDAPSNAPEERRVEIQFVS